MGMMVLVQTHTSLTSIQRSQLTISRVLRLRHTVAFELTILFGALATIIGLFVLSRLPSIKPTVVYDPEFSSGRYGVYVEGSHQRLEEARRIMNEQEPIELREGEADD